MLRRTARTGLVIPPSAVISDESAAWIHRVDVDPPQAHVVASPVSVFQEPGHTRVRRAGCAGGERALEERDVTVIDGVRVLTRLRLACGSGETAYLDLGNEQLRFAVEYDGEDWHTSDEQRAADARRRGRLTRERGWGILVLRREHVPTRDRQVTIDVVRRGLACHLAGRPADA